MPKRLAIQNEQMDQEAVWSVIRYLDPDGQDKDREAKCNAIIAILALLLVVCAVGVELWLRVSGATLSPLLLQQCDVHYEEQRHEEPPNQYERETLHKPSVVKRAEQDCVQKIGDAQQVP